MAKGPDKETKREARKLRDEARGAFESGDYRRAKLLDRKIAEMAPGTSMGAEAAKEAQNLRTDPAVLGVGIAAALLYLAAWLISF